MHRLALFLLCLAVSLPSVAEKIVIGVENGDQFPLYRGDGPEYVGFARDLFDGFAAKYGYTVEYRALPIPRLYDELFHTRRVDLKFPDNPEWKQDIRAGFEVTYSAPVVNVTEGAYVRPSALGHGVDAIKTFGAVRGFTPWPYNDRIKAGKIAYNEFNSFDSLLRAVIAGHIDMAYANRTVMEYYLDQTLRTPGALLFDPSLPTTQADFRVSTIRRPDVVKHFDEYLRTDKTQIAQLRAKYQIFDLR